MADQSGRGYYGVADQSGRGYYGVADQSGRGYYGVADQSGRGGGLYGGGASLEAVSNSLSSSFVSRDLRLRFGFVNVMQINNAIFNYAVGQF